MSEPYTPQTDAALEQLAQAIVAGQVWSSYNGDDALDAFMVIHLMDESAREWCRVNEIAFAYEYLNKAGPLSVNGRPSFFSVKFLSKADAERLHERVKANAQFAEDRLKQAGKESP